MSLRSHLSAVLSGLCLLLSAALAGPSAAQAVDAAALVSVRGELPMETAEAVGPVTGFALPRFVSLKSNEINLRNGPGTRYPISWVLQRQDLPVVVIDEFEFWRQIRTYDGVVGWVHKNLISGKRTFRVMDERLALRRSPEADGPVVALLAEGFIGELNRCRELWCRVTVIGPDQRRYRGWLPRSGLFGVARDELL